MLQNPQPGRLKQEAIQVSALNNWRDNFSDLSSEQFSHLSHKKTKRHRDLQIQKMFQEQNSVLLNKREQPNSSENEPEIFLTKNNLKRLKVNLDYTNYQVEKKKKDLVSKYNILKKNLKNLKLLEDENLRRISALKHYTAELIDEQIVPAQNFITRIDQDY